jgi:hypothetical protein
MWVGKFNNLYTREELIAVFATSPDAYITNTERNIEATTL